jgi:hypothetical protein
MSSEPRNTIVAGAVRATCLCCPEPNDLLDHTSLDALRRYCPSTHLTYLDRGDGLYEQDGQHLPLGGSAGSEIAAATLEEPSVLSDRPRKTEAKTRIELERATFANATS